MAFFYSEELDIIQRQKLLTSGIGPRPIALVSTQSKDGIKNLAPFSFFNAFGANPPILAFSPARRGRDGSLKDTYNNCLETKECAIATVTYPMVEQVSLSSTEYPPQVNEFLKAGLSEESSKKITPSGVKESPIWFECRVLNIIHTGTKNSAGNIVICEILCFHIKDDVLKEDTTIDSNMADIVGRFANNDYVRASGNALFEIPKPTTMGMGFDSLPKYLRFSKILSANNLARLANQTEPPQKENATRFVSSIDPIPFDTLSFAHFEKNKQPKKMLAMIRKEYEEKKDAPSSFIERTIRSFLLERMSNEAWYTIKYFESLFE